VINSILYIMLLLSIPALAEESQIISGRVVDTATKAGIPDVNLFIPSQKIGVATDEAGAFHFTMLKDEKAKLHVSHIGYTSSTIRLNGSTEDMIIALDETFFELEDVVVTSTRTEKLHRHVPVATEVISKKDIIDSGALNVAELLSSRSGVSLQTSVDGGSMLNLMGMDSRYILILVDGQPVTGKFNNRVQLDHISTNDVQKVEIIKGPNSSLYGSEAMAGVVNIITSASTSDQSLNISARYGGTENKLTNDGLNHGSSSYRLGWTHTFGTLKASLNADMEKMETDKEIQQIEIDDIHKQSLRGRLLWLMNADHTLMVNGTVYNHDETGASQLMNTETFIDRTTLILTHDWQMRNGWLWNHALQNHNYSRNYVQTRPWGDVERDDITQEENIEYEGMLKKKFGLNEFNVGLEFSQAAYVSDRVDNGRQTVSSKSIFGQYDIHFWGNINAVIGTRLDMYNEDQSVISPRIGIMYTFNDRWKFRSTWGKGFRTPSFMERFIDWDHVQFGYRVQGNPDLKPEISNGYTAGVEYYHPTVYQVSLMMYYTTFKNLIEDFAIEPALLSYHNIEKAVYKGLEIQGRWRASSSLVASWGLNIIDNRDGDGNIIPNTQPLSAYCRGSYQAPRHGWGFSTRVKWVGAYTPEEYDPDSGTYIHATETLADYVIIDISTSLKIWNPLIMNFGIKNAGDYTHDRYGPFIGRAVYIELSTTLKGD